MKIENNNELIKLGERIDQLYENGIKVIQHPDVFCFSLDAILLYQFANPKRSPNAQIVDFCAGNGAVGLFLSAKTKGQITGIEIQPRLAEMAERSVLLNDLSERMQVLTLDLNNSTDYLAKDSIDYITCNPPYFAVDATSQKNPNEYLAIARHELLINLEQILKASSQLLKTGGKLAMIHRPERLGEIFALMNHYQLAPKRVQLVYPKANKDANMVLVEAIKQGKPGVKFLPPLIVYQPNNEYTKQVAEMIYGK